MRFQDRSQSSYCPRQSWEARGKKKNALASKKLKYEMTKVEHDMMVLKWEDKHEKTMGKCWC